MWRMARKTPRGAKLLREFFASSELTQAELARLIGEYPQTISHLLAGRRTPTLAQALGIERYTGVPAREWCDASVTISR